MFCIVRSAKPPYVSPKPLLICAVRVIGSVLPANCRHRGPPAPSPRRFRRRLEGNAAMSSQSTKTARYGSWKSPITSDLLVAQSVPLAELYLHRGHVYWLEARPQ